MAMQSEVPASASTDPGAASDNGFTLIETIMSIFVVSVVMGSLTSFFVTTVSITNRQGGIQVATQVAAAATSLVRSMKGSDLVDGRDAATSHAQWTTAVAEAEDYLNDMVEATDSAAAPGAGTNAALPTAETQVTINGVSFGRNFYVGHCWQPLGGGQCAAVQTVGYVPFYRVVVVVTWPDRGCAASRCAYVTSTLVSSAPTDPVFNSNMTATRPRVVNPGNQTGLPNSAVNLQLAGTGGAAPQTWSFTGLPPGVNGASSGLLTGALPGTLGSYTVTAKVTDGFGLTGTATFRWDVSAATYAQTVLNDDPWAYHRLEEGQSSSATSAVADSSGNNHPGVYAGRTNGPTTWWEFEEGSGTSVVDSSGAANTGTLLNGSTYNTGPHRGNASFDGTDDVVRGTSAGVHTNRDFTVIAWVSLAAKGGVDQAVVSQSGKVNYGYSLRYDAASDRWAFATTNADTPGSTVTLAKSVSTANTGGWTRLAGVFDASASTSTLYVNGVAQSSVTRAAGWDARGELYAGVDLVNGTVGRHLKGNVDEVRTYQRALSASEIAGLAATSGDVRWDFSEGSGSTTADINNGGGSQIDGTFGSAATWAGPGNGHAGDGATFTGDATNGYVKSATRAVHTNASFGVSAWVYRTSGGAYRTAVSQVSGTQAGFYLQYVQSSGKWGFAMPWSDTMSASGDLQESLNPAAVNTWVHLAGVFDAAAATMTLYVDGVAQGSAPHTAAHTWDATGVLEVGRGKYNGGPVDAWVGSVDSVRVAQRTWSSTEIKALASEPPDSNVATDVPGALGSGSDKNSTAAAFGGVTNGYTNTAMTAPASGSTELWFRAAPGQAGLLAGFYSTRTGQSPGRDRQVYVDSGGRLTFGVWPTTAPVTVRSLARYDDGQWHHAVTSFGAGGLRLYVDGSLAAADPSTTTAGGTTGYWRWGSGWFNLWPNRPVDQFTGSLDEIAIYTRELTAQEVRRHYEANPVVAGKVSRYAEAVSANSGLVNYWRLGESAGASAADSAPAANNGVYGNSPTLGVAGALTGNPNTAVTVNGSNQYVAVTRQIQDDFSIEFFFRSTQGIGTGATWHSGAGLVDAEKTGAQNDFGIGLRSDGKIVAGSGTLSGADVNIMSAAGHNDGAWHHVVLTRTKATGLMALYVDGLLSTSGTAYTNTLNATPTINFGRVGTGSNYLAGTIDEVAFYGTALTNTEIATHYARR